MRMDHRTSRVCSIALPAIGALLAASPCFADATAYSCSPTTPRNVVVTTRAGACAGFVWKRDQGAPIQVQFPMLVSGEVLGSNDGRTVVAIQSNLRGGMRPDGTLYAADDAASKRDPVAVLIYRDGKQIAAYHFAELLSRPRMVTLSVSHVQWLRGMSRFDQSNGMKLLLITTSLREITFDLQSGHIEMQRDSREWTDCDVIACGTVSRLGTMGQMAAPHLAKGSAPEAIRFTIAPTLELDNAGLYGSLCLKNRPSGLVAVSAIPVMFNALAPPAQPAPQAHAAQASAPDVHFEIDLQAVSDEWKLLIRFDIPLQQLDARVVGTEKWSHSGFDLNGVAYIDMEHVPEDALIEIQAVDGLGKKIGPYRKRFDTRATVRRLFTTELAAAPQRWVDISSMSNGNYISFHELVQRRCALREIRYSIDNRSLDRRFPLPHCDFADPSGGDFTEDISWPTMPEYVAVQVVFSDGSVSKVMIERAKR